MAVPVDAVVEIHQLYGHQAHRIDSGDAEGWAATFTPDGVFSSPTYPGRVVGTSQLIAFAERFTADALAAGEVRRHVVSTLAVDAPEPGRTDGRGSDELDVRAYLQVVATPRGGVPRLVRLATLLDRVVRHEGGWRVRARTVQRDDAVQQENPSRGVQQ
ncbi:nuclear transport factor 2 family protein [Pseudonocardia sp. MH-G8]|uniref:nuclear transport factor 2 family protein n=1 Tax=Pseudonocardia sp. MH-G8 TaxID=1854588 RepID=UPI000BA0E6B0|nr:nuclear transport factor 2 family protein [Pseudonocardia sp. MH-G8]OZM76849.1 hypothetical protein CFP66_38600 [Pseudonocardia sp. MH-G8]